MNECTFAYTYRRGGPVHVDFDEIQSIDCHACKYVQMRNQCAFNEYNLHSYCYMHH